MNLLRQVEEMEQAIRRNKKSAQQANIVLLENLLSSYNVTGEKKPLEQLLDRDRVPELSELYKQ